MQSIGHLIIRGYVWSAQLRINTGGLSQRIWVLILGKYQESLLALLPAALGLKDHIN